MYICYGIWTYFEASNPGDAFGVKRIFDFIAALWLEMNALFSPHGVCVGGGGGAGRVRMCTICAF